MDTGYVPTLEKMQLLLITNLYPPQELGGYGRCMADFAWGFLQRGHHVQVLCNDAPYLGYGGKGPSGERVFRTLKLKGSFDNGVQHLEDAEACTAVDIHNRAVISQILQQETPDGVLLGNLDLLGAEMLSPLLSSGLPLLHHIGFVYPPFPAKQRPTSLNYRMVAASEAVRVKLLETELSAINIPVVYPGARVDLFGSEAVPRPLPPTPDGSVGKPLRVCFAGLQMASKGPHTLLEALSKLRQNGVIVESMIAGGSFQKNYADQLRMYCKQQQIEQQVQFLPQLRRDQLAKLFRVNHVFVFTSLHPEAFGIVPVEAMASGLALVSSGVGGAAEVFTDGISGLHYPAGDAGALAERLSLLAKEPKLLKNLQKQGEQHVRRKFNVTQSVEQLEELLLL